MIPSGVVGVVWVGADAMQPLQGSGEYYSPMFHVGLALHQPLPAYPENPANHS